MFIPNYAVIYPAVIRTGQNHKFESYGDARGKVGEDTEVDRIFKL